MSETKPWGERAKRLGKFVWELLPDLGRKFVVWGGSFAIGSAPSAVLAKVWPIPTALAEFGSAANEAGVFREFLFLGVSVSGVAVLNALDQVFSGQHPFSRYRLTYLAAFVLVVVLLTFCIYVLLTMAQMPAGQPIPQAEMAPIVDSVRTVVYAALAVELIFALNAARAKQDSKAIPGDAATSQGGA